MNAPTSLAAIGSAFNFQIDPSFSLGVGTLAGSSVSNNVGPMHLINFVTVAERQEHIEVRLFGSLSLTAFQIATFFNRIHFFHFK